MLARARTAWALSFALHAGAAGLAIWSWSGPELHPGARALPFQVERASSRPAPAVAGRESLPRRPPPAAPLENAVSALDTPPAPGARSAAGDPDSASVPAVTAIHARIQGAIRYPRVLSARRKEGRTEVSVRVAPGGELEQAEVSGSSGEPAFDEAALAAVREAAPYPENTTGKRLNFRLPVDFKLRN